MSIKMEIKIVIFNLFLNHYSGLHMLFCLTRLFAWGFTPIRGGFYHGAQKAWATPKLVSFREMSIYCRSVSYGSLVGGYTYLSHKIHYKLYRRVINPTCRMFQAMRSTSSWDATDWGWSGNPPNSWSLPQETAFWYHSVCQSSLKFLAPFHMP